MKYGSSCTVVCDSRIQQLKRLTENITTMNTKSRKQFKQSNKKRVTQKFKQFYVKMFDA